MIVVDEAQDTAEDQWQSVRLLSTNTQLVCLADLDQQIYDFRPGVSSERVKHIMAALRPLRVDLESQNHRSPKTTPTSRQPCCKAIDYEMRSTARRTQGYELQSHLVVPQNRLVGNG